MRLWPFAFLLLLGPAVRAQSRVQYTGGTSPLFAPGTQGLIELTDDHYFAFYTKKAQVRVAYDQINLIEYGQQVSRRIGEAIALMPFFMAGELVAMTKKRKHFLSLIYTDDAGKQQALVFRVDKNDIRAALVSMEARTGLTVQFQDQEARKGDQ